MGVLRHRGPLGSQVPTPETPPLGQALEQLRIPSSGWMLGLGDVHRVLLAPGLRDSGTELRALWGWRGPGCSLRVSRPSCPARWETVLAWQSTAPIQLCPLPERSKEHPCTH